MKNKKDLHNIHPTSHNCNCCSQGLPKIDKKTFFSMSRRDFLSGLGAAGVGALAIPSCQSYSDATKSTDKAIPQIGSALRVKAALYYETPKRQHARSWRSWGGIQTQNDADREIKKITEELKTIVSNADFPVEILPVAGVTNVEQANAARDTDCDAILIYAAGANLSVFEALAASNKPAITFVRHKSGPIYCEYETAHPIFLRKFTDEYKQPNMDVWDIVVDDYNELLWRLRALYGLKNTLGTKIVAIGGAGGWGSGSKFGPETARNIWKFDIRPIDYKDLEPMLKNTLQDKTALQQAQHDAHQYLRQKGISLHTDKVFLTNAFLLTKVFKELMARENALAITIAGCMTTIMPISQTTACVPLSLINDEGLMAFCESDFVVIPSGVLLRHISGRPVFLNDPTYPYNRVVTIAHCTAPRKMNGRDYEPTEIWTHFESDYGAAPKVQMRKGQYLTNLVPNFQSTKWIGFKGKIIDHPFYDICRSQVDITIEGDWKKLLKDMQGFHWMTCYGDYLREVEYAIKKVGIGWENITA